MEPKAKETFRTSVVLFYILRNSYLKNRHVSPKSIVIFFSLLALQPPLGVVFYNPLVGFSLLACEVS